MSLRSPYRLISTGKHLVSLNGRTVRPRPLVAVSVVGPAGTRVRDSLVDSGSDECVFPDSVASLIGVDLRRAPVGIGAGIGLHPVALRYAEVTLRIATSAERREWQAWVGFTPGRLDRPVLGFAGFLQFFTATFDGEREQLELKVNALYRGR